MTWILVIATVLLVAQGAFFAAGEAAIGMMPLADVRQLADKTESRALARIADDPAAHQDACGFLRVSSETAAAVCVAVLLTTVIPIWWVALLVAAGIMSIASFVLVGASPRSIGRSNPERVLEVSAGAISLAKRSIGPFARGLSWFASRGPARSRSTVASEDHLLKLVDKATEFDVLEDEERELIHSVVEFGDTIAREVMVPRTDMVTVPRDVSASEAMGVFMSKGYSRVPVAGEDIDEIIGVLFLRDVAKQIYERGEALSDNSIAPLAHPPVFIPESKPAGEVLRQMQLDKVHMAIVIDEYGGVAGLVTMEDLIEELLGDIADEYDREAPEIVALPDGAYRVSARLDIDELAELFDIEIDEDEVDSVGGLFVKSYGRLATPGATTRVAGLELTAEHVDEDAGRVLTLVARKDPDAHGDTDE